MSGPYGPDCDHVLWLKEQACRKDMRDAFSVGAMAYSVSLLSLGSVLLAEGWWLAPAIFGALCIWCSTLYLTISVFLATKSYP